MTNDEKAYVKEICIFFYPSNPPSSINDALADLAAKMLYRALEKSKALNFVSRPSAGKPGIAWLLLQAVKTFWRTSAKQKIYKIARDEVAREHRTAYDLAREGEKIDI